MVANTDTAVSLPQVAGRIVVFTGSLNFTVRRGIAAIDQALPGLQWLVLVRSQRRSPGVLWKNQKLNFKRHGWRWIPYQALDLIRRVASAAKPYEPLAPTPGHESTLLALKAKGNLRVETVEDIHAEETLDKVRQFAPDLGLSLAAPILKRALFALPRLGTINLHKGRLPDFRGMPPAFWEMWTDQDGVGCSVHVVDDKLDTGPLLAERFVRRERFSTVRGLQLELDEVAFDLTTGVVRDILAGQAKPRAQAAGAGRTFKRPTLAQQAALSARLAPRVALGTRLKSAAKDAIDLSQLALHRLHLDRLMAPRLTVLLYHRVADDARDNLTAGIAQFEADMQWVSSHCQMLSIEDVVGMVRVPRSSRPLVAVTFDDGYLDNYRFAAPILRRYGVPAAFFVSTGIVNSTLPFPHDVRRKNPPLEKMSWDQLREMRQWGFTIGSHTVNHIDCAKEPEEVVRSELAQSRDDLARELSLDRPILAYPYGGRQHMTPARLELVKLAGYAGCLSAYGGVNVGSVDRFNVLRRTVSHEFSALSVQRMCLGLL